MISRVRLYGNEERPAKETYVNEKRPVQRKQVNLFTGFKQTRDL